MSSVLTAGLAIAVVGAAGRLAASAAPKAFEKVVVTTRSWDALRSAIWNNAKYYRGGFEPGRMTKREASLILGVSPSSSAKKIGDAHKRVMLLNHPDRRGSPYLAAKINEARAVLHTVAR